MGLSVARALPLAAILLAGCFAPRPSALREDVGDRPAVLVKSLRIPTSEPWYARFAHHTWFDVRQTEGGLWTRIEVPTPEAGLVTEPVEDAQAFADQRWGRRVEVRAAYAGEGVDRLARRILIEARAYEPNGYRAWPGPNSNTFAEAILRRVDGVAAQLDPNAVGKDYGLRAGWSESGAGVQADAWLIGAQLGLLEGVELHLFGLTLGVGIYPLALKLPFVPSLEVEWLPIRVVYDVDW